MAAPAHVNPPTLLANAVATQRVYSVDAFRGITILVMIFVNELAGVSGLPAWTKHAGADDNSMTYVDVVFPAFLFIVGMSIPFAIASRLRKNDSPLKLWTHILFRTLGLLVLGVFMVNAEGGYNEDAMLISIPAWSFLFIVCAILVWNTYSGVNKSVAITLRTAGVAGLIILAFLYRSSDGSAGMSPQWWGILGLIGWAYLFCCTIYVSSNGSISAILISMIIAFSIYCLGKEFENSSHAVLQFLASQKGHATHTGITLAGAFVSLILFSERVSHRKTRLMLAFLFGVASIIAGFLLEPRYFISKIYATPSWALFSIGSCVFIFLFLHWLMDVEQKSGWSSFIQPAAANPLLTYLIPFMIFAIMGITGVHRPSVFSDGLAGVLWSAAYALAIVSIVTYLNRLKIKLQL